MSAAVEAMRDSIAKAIDTDVRLLLLLSGVTKAQFDEKLPAIRDEIASHALGAILRDAPSGNFRPRFEPGERVALGAFHPGGQDRPGVVVAIDTEPVVHHHLRVRFDDGEERQINPDVMRRERK
jgi:hypothetical protein